MYVTIVNSLNIQLNTYIFKMLKIKTQETEKTQGRNKLQRKI